MTHPRTLIRNAFVSRLTDASDQARRLHNLIHYGVVAEVNHAAGTMRVDLQDGQLRSDWIPWITMRAGPQPRSATDEEIMAWDEAHKASPDWGQFRTAIRTENGYSSAFIAALQADPMVAHTLGSRLDTFQMSGEFSLSLFRVSYSSTYCFT